MREPPPPSRQKEITLPQRGCLSPVERELYLWECSLHVWNVQTPQTQHTERLPQGKEGQAWNDHCGHSQEKLPDLVRVCVRACACVCVCVWWMGVREG